MTEENAEVNSVNKADEASSSPIEDALESAGGIIQEDAREIIEKASEASEVSEVSEVVVDEENVEVLVADDGNDSPKEKLEEPEEEEDDEDCFFVTEDDLFDVVIRYKKVSGDIVVDGVDTDFVVDGETDEDSEKKVEETEEERNAKIKEIRMTIKDISHGDCDIISNSARIKGISGDENFTVREYNILECVRFSVLVRSWTLKADLNEENVFKLNPKIVKAALNGIRLRMGSEGIL